MADDELSLLWQHLTVLNEAVINLVALQRQVLETRGSVDTEPIEGQLEALRERLEEYQVQAHRRSIRADGDPHFTTVEVERINVVEVDGRVRLTISNQEQAPDAFIQGRTAKRQGGNAAGMIFFNDEGDECGGLAFGGREVDGERRANGALLFDQFRGDQTVGILYEEQDGQRSAGLTVWDRPEVSLGILIDEYNRILAMDEGPERDEEVTRLRVSGLAGAHRVFVGKTPDRSAVLSLCDPKGNVRLRLAVNAEGNPSLELLDADGTVVQSIR